MSLFFRVLARTALRSLEESVEEALGFEPCVLPAYLQVQGASHLPGFCAYGPVVLNSSSELDFITLRLGLISSILPALPSLGA